MTLSLGVVACSDAEDAAGTAGDALSSATDAAGSALDDATGGANASGESAEPGQGENGQDGAGEDGAGGSGEDGAGGEGADGAGGDGAGGGETTEVESADGSTLTVPAAAVSVAEQAGFGAPTEVEEGSDGKTLVSYAEGFVVNSKEGGAQPLIGMIGETWIGEGGLDAGVGVPTAPEEANAEGTGWVQEFSNGVVSWVNDGSGEFKADIQQN